MELHHYTVRFYKFVKTNNYNKYCKAVQHRKLIIHRVTYQIRIAVTLKCFVIAISTANSNFDDVWLLLATLCAIQCAHVFRLVYYSATRSELHPRLVKHTHILSYQSTDTLFILPRYLKHITTSRALVDNNIFHPT